MFSPISADGKELPDVIAVTNMPAYHRYPTPGRSATATGPSVCLFQLIRIFRKQSVPDIVHTHTPAALQRLPHGSAGAGTDIR